MSQETPRGGAAPRAQVVRAHLQEVLLDRPWAHRAGLGGLVAIFSFHL